MYDNIDLRLNKERANVDFLAEVPNYLSNISETYFNDGGISLGQIVAAGKMLDSSRSPDLKMLEPNSKNEQLTEIVAS